ncbi:MAG: CHASE2 domain-containing protein [Lachnoclostridium sp.]|nr:CHASE2 domain-containing protein [Lachnoclostridium sp.]
MIKQILNNPLFFKPVLATIIAIGLTYIVGSDVNSDMIMSMLCGSSDIEVSDFYNRIHAGGSSKEIADDYLIVNIDTVTGRAELAALVADISAAEPRVIGLDALFGGVKDAEGDSILVNRLQSTPRLVVAQRYSDAAGCPVTDFVSENLPDMPRGMVNLTSETPRGIIREFTPYFGDDLAASLPVAMLGVIAPDEISGLDDGSAERLIRYSDKEFYIAEPSEVTADPELCRGKIVLIGTVTERADLHPTPLADFYPGVLIHANALDMMLRHDYINPSSETYNLILEILACLLMSVLYVYLDASQNFVLRVLPIIWMALILWTGCYAYSYWGIYLNAPRTMLIAALAMFVLDIWYAFEMPCRRLFSRLKMVKLRRATVIALVVSTAMSASARTLDIYSLTGVVAKKSASDWVSLSKPGQITDSDVLRINPKSSIKVVDKASRKVYTFDTRGEATVKSLIEQGNREKASITKRIVAESRRKMEAGKSHDAVGAAERATLDEELLESLYTALCQGFDKGINSGCITMTIISEGDGLFHLSLSNTGDQPMYANVMLSIDGSPWSAVYESDDEDPALLIPAGDTVELVHDTLLAAPGMRLVAVGYAQPFDAGELSDMFAERMQPESEAATGVSFYFIEL